MKLVLPDLTSLANVISALARLVSNNRAIEAAVENTLSRDGTSPNEMNADLDMNSNQIINLPAAGTPTEPVRKAEFDDLVARVNADPNSKVITINVVIDGGGAPIITGLKGFIEVPVNAILDRYTLLADQTGSIVIDVWKCSYSQFDGVTHPVVSDSICGSNLPTISSAVKNQDTLLNTWSKQISDGDILAFKVISATNIKRVTLSLRASKP